MNNMDFYSLTTDVSVDGGKLPVNVLTFDEKFIDNTSQCPISNPILESLIEDVCIKGSYLIEPLSTHVCELQNMFLDSLYNKLEKAGIALSEKITISQNLEGKLTVIDEHPEKEAIQQVLDEAPKLAEVFYTLSSHSEIARDIVNINRIFATLTDEERHNMEEINGYHLSLKGGMSHFYFI